MKLFQVQAHVPLSDDHVNVAEAVMMIAIALANDAEQPTAHAFSLSVTENTVNVQVMRSDGQEVFARLQFDGQQFSLLSEGLV